MSDEKKRREDDELGKLLRDAWPADAGKERGTFLKRLKLVLTPNHPGLLYLSGKAKRLNGNGPRDETRWRLNNAASFVATWAAIAMAVLVVVFGMRYILSTPAVAPGPADTELGGLPAVADDAGSDEMESIDKYIYKFNGFEITEYEKLTLAQINKEINRKSTTGLHLTITAMKEVENYNEEMAEITYSVFVYQLEGYWSEKTEDDKEGFTPRR